MREMMIALALVLFATLILVGGRIVLDMRAPSPEQEQSGPPSFPAPLTASPERGPAPLLVTITLWGIDGVWIDFGDGTRVEPVCSGGEGSTCTNPGKSLEHVYEAAGSYTLRYGFPGGDPESFSLTVTAW